MNTPHPQSVVSARARHIRPTSQMPAHFSVQLSLVLALSAYSVHALAQDATHQPDAAALARDVTAFCLQAVSARPYKES